MHARQKKNTTKCGEEKKSKKELNRFIFHLHFCKSAIFIILKHSKLHFTVTFSVNKF